MTATVKPIITENSIMARLHIAEITGQGTALTFDGHNYNTFFIKGDDADFKLIDQLRSRYYMVHGWGFGSKGFGYTVVFNQERKGVFKQYPHQSCRQS